MFPHTNPRINITIRTSDRDLTEKHYNRVGLWEGRHCQQQAVWRNGGCGSLKSIKWLVASTGSPPLRQAAGRRLAQAADREEDNKV